MIIQGRLLDLDGDGVSDGCDGCIGQLLDDPGFEADGDGWFKVNNGGRLVTESTSHSGQNALQMQVHGSWPREVYQDIAVSAGDTYAASVWVRTEDIGGDGVTVSLYWLDGFLTNDDTTGHALSVDIVGTATGTNGWTLLSGQFVAPTGAVAVRLDCFTSTDPDGSGTAWFDDAAICKRTIP